jgi:hypothetical protein
VAAFVDGKQRRVSLVREADNPVDRNAVAVYGEWLTQDEPRSGRLGYIPAERAAQLAAEHQGSDFGATLEVMYRARPGKSPGIRIDIWGRADKPEIPSEKAYVTGIPIPADFVDRNLRGQDLEKQGLVENAIELYEANVRDGFDGNFPYDRLAVIYRRRKQFDREAAVLRRAVQVFEIMKDSPRSDVAPKLAAFRKRLEKAESLLRRGTR